MPLKILTIADAVSPQLYDYFQPERWRDVDLVLSAGDLPPEYLDFLTTTLGVPIFYVRGNHDGSYPASRFDGFVNVHGTIAEYRGIRIAGFEGCRRYNHGSVQYREDEMRRIVRRSRVQAARHGTPHIVLTHAPPGGCHDSSDPCHQGFACFRELIDIWKPEFLIHGHVHSYNRGPTSSTIGTTTVLNAFPYRTFEVAEPVASTPPRTSFRRQLIRQMRVRPLH
jgi:Icc-related predicted phosphoesterase